MRPSSARAALPLRAFVAQLFWALQQKKAGHAHFLECESMSARLFTQQSIYTIYGAALPASTAISPSKAQNQRPKGQIQHPMDQIQPPKNPNERTGDKATRPKPNHPQRVAQKTRLKTNITINEPEGNRDKGPAKQRVQERRSRESREGQRQQAKKPGSPSPNKASMTTTHKIRHFVRLSFGKVSFSSRFARFSRENTSLCTDFRQMLKTCHFVRLTDEKVSI